jgi:hypothetical protein
MRAVISQQPGLGKFTPDMMKDGEPGMYDP